MVHASEGPRFISLRVGWLCVFEGRSCILIYLLHMATSVQHEMRTHSPHLEPRHNHTSTAHQHFIFEEGLGRRVSLLCATQITTTNQTTAEVGQEPLRELRSFRSGAILDWIPEPWWRNEVYLGWHTVRSGISRT